MRQNNPVVHIFRSATLQLTVWYLGVLMAISFIFSVAIYQIASNDMQAKVDDFQSGLQRSMGEEKNTKTSVLPTVLQASQELKDSDRLIAELIYLNMIILLLGGFISYVLAKRNLLPIRQAHEAQSRFTSDASHELRTPLAVMRTELEVALNDKSASTKSLKKVLSSSLEEVNKLSKLSEVLLNLSRLETAKLNFASVSLNKTVHSVIKDFKQPAERFDVNATGQIVVQGNETALRDLIRVLIENALQYSPNTSTIVIRLSKQDKMARFEICNEGPGIAADKLPHIFERFYRADQSRTDSSHRGYGLGLALANTIANLHGGHLIASSKPGKSTTFKLLLPLWPNNH